MPPDTPTGPAAGRLLTDLPDASQGEVFSDLLRRPGCRIERIVSQGQVTPVAQPYCQPHEEWVMVISGHARVRMHGAETALGPGDYLHIPAQAEHWVSFTDPGQPTVWLAIHLEEA